MATTALHPGGISGAPYTFTVKTVTGVVIIQNPDISEARDIILTEFKTQWDLDSATTGIPIAYQDVSFVTPSSGPWIEINIDYDDSRPWALGRVLKRRAGQVSIMIYTPFGQGLFTAYNLGIIALNALKGKNLESNVWLSNATISEVGIVGNNSVLEVTVDFVHSQLQ